MLNRGFFWITVILVLIMAVIPAGAQSNKEGCESYETVTIGSPALIDEGIDLTEVRCTTLFVQDEDGLITNVFVIPESLVGAYLPGADLSGVDFTGLDFSYAVLRNAMLSGISASTVMFIDTDFSDADLSESDLSYAYFNFAVLDGTNFTGADLTGAELSDAFILSTDFTDALMDGVIGYEGGD